MRIPPETEVALRRLGVRSFYLFGSRALGKEGPRSDFDFAALMDHAGYRRGDATYDAMYDLLSPLCPRTLENDVIDIVFLNDAPLELKTHVVRYGKVLFDADPKARLCFEERTLKSRADFQPILEETDRAILASL